MDASLITLIAAITIMACFGEYMKYRREKLDFERWKAERETNDPI